MSDTLPPKQFKIIQPLAVRTLNSIKRVPNPRVFLWAGKMATAVLVDGGFFLRRYRSVCGSQSPKEVAVGMHQMCRRHLKDRTGNNNESRKRSRKLFRIFYYDCPPLQKKAHNPVTGKSIDFSKTETAKWRLEFFDELKKLRKVALRLGDLNEKSGHWTVSQSRMKDLLKKSITVDELTEDDVRYDVKQKGVDMRIGLDIASMCYRRFVDQIILVAGDSDFVPAAKLARREGVDFILDPIWARIRPDLFEHIDGLRSVLPRPQRPQDKALEERDHLPNQGEQNVAAESEFGAGVD